MNSNGHINPNDYRNHHDCIARHQGICKRNTKWNSTPEQRTPQKTILYTTIQYIWPMHNVTRCLYPYYDKENHVLRLLNCSRTSFSANLGSMITCLAIWLQRLHIHATALFKAITMLWMPWKSNVSICWYSEYCDGQCVYLMRSTLTWHGIRVKNQPH